LVQRKKLYGFDAGRDYNFVKLSFANKTALNKVKGLWYTGEWGKNRRLQKSIFMSTRTELYEAKLPPLLRYFHIMDISPTGWIRLLNPKRYSCKPTTCDEDFTIQYNDICPLKNKEDAIPLKILSFDIEASSSHGDFPLPRKRYEKLAGDILDYWDEDCEGNTLQNVILVAFNFMEDEDNLIHEVFPKQRITEVTLKKRIKGLMRGNKIIDLLDSDMKRGDKYEELCKRLTTHLPEIEGDKVTFIGSSFMTMGESEPYYNHCVALNSCDKVENGDIECCDNERDVLLKWVELVQRENPDVIIGYNIFGFDWKFMFARADELNCKEEFLQLSKLKNHQCKEIHKTIRIASGEHNLEYPDIIGRVQIDLYNYFRRQFNFESYKLDNVSKQLIGDKVKSFEIVEGRTKIISSNLMGLKVGNYISFEEMGHSIDMYDGGRKMKVCQIDKKCFYIETEEKPNMKKSVRWCLAKDDVTPQDIFRLTNQGSKERGIVAKYCIMDCVLVNYLLNKIDILTGFMEMGSINNVPISFIVFRGQGIKLFSLIAKRCREKNILMPVLSRDWRDKMGYEGAICFPPKSNLYLDDPIAVVDYASLYPSSMISENLSQDSKVWTKEYDLGGNPLKETGEKDSEGNFKYDNLPQYKYVDVEYDVFEYYRKTEKSAQIKRKVGKKICRFAQFPNGENGIMPMILKQLLAARKATRVMGKYKTVQMKDKSFSGLLSEKDEKYFIKQKNGETVSINKEDAISVEDTYDDFMKNIFDKRQQGYKVTANSVYGGCGAPTSDFYDKDIAASTTATGRKLLTYARRVIEEVYKDKICETKHGTVKVTADVIYGDSVLSDTPLLLRNKLGQIIFKQIDEVGEDWFSYDGFKMGEGGRRNKEQSFCRKYEIWTNDGWSAIHRVIKHKTKKKIYRITTHTGMVDVTEDHSLLDENIQKLKPNEAKIGMKLLHRYPIFGQKKIKLKDILNYIDLIHTKTWEEKRAFIWGFFFGDGSCGKYECPSGLKYSWGLNQKDYKFCSKLQCLLIDVFGDYFKINNTLKSSGVYKIVPNCGNIKKYTMLFRNKCYNKDKFKIIPTEFLNENYNIRFAYLSGYYAADGSKCPGEKSKTIRISNKGKIGSAMLFYMFKSIGLNVSVNTRKDKRNITRISATSGKQRKHPCTLKKVDFLYKTNDEYVYDIETSSGNFNTGYPLIVKNTDSAFFKFDLTNMKGEKIGGKTALEITIELALKAGELATKMLKAPHDLEYEKTFWPFCLLSKKKYVGMLYEFDPNKCKRKSMGIVLKRRDNAAIVKEVYGGVIDILMKKQDVAKAVQYTHECLHNLADGKYLIDKLKITKSLRGFYKNPRQIAHKVLADRMTKRDPGNKPSAGTRIPYAYIIKKGAKLQGERIETPEFIKKNNLRIDYGHYITNQIMKPLLQVFALDNIMNKLPQINRFKLNALRRKIKNMKETVEKDKFLKKSNALKEKMVKGAIFDPILKKIKQKENNDAKKKFISSFF